MFLSSNCHLHSVHQVLLEHQGPKSTNSVKHIQDFLFNEILVKWMIGFLDVLPAFVRVSVSEKFYYFLMLFLLRIYIFYLTRTLPL